jgi:DNA-binding protein YbaB
MLNGKGEMRGLSLDKSIVDPEDIEVLEDLIVAAYNDAKVKVEATVSEKMKEVTGGMNLPEGFKLPF